MKGVLNYLWPWTSGQEKLSTALGVGGFSTAHNYSISSLKSLVAVTAHLHMASLQGQVSCSVPVLPWLFRGDVQHSA